MNYQAGPVLQTVVAGLIAPAPSPYTLPKPEPVLVFNNQDSSSSTTRQSETRLTGTTTPPSSPRPLIEFHHRPRTDYDFISPYVFPTKLHQPTGSKTNKVAVLDIDETMVHSFFETQEVAAVDQTGIWTRHDYSDVRRIAERANIQNAGPPGEGRIDSIVVVFRPGLQSFLARLTRYTSMIIIWSAGRPKYVHRAKSLIFRDLPEPQMLLTSEQCKTHPVTKRTYKPLEYLFERYPGVICPENTLIIDNSPDNIGPNHENGILIPDYLPIPALEWDEKNPRPTHRDGGVEHSRPTITEDDDRLSRLMDWLETPEVMRADDVRKLDKSRIFA